MLLGGSPMHKLSFAVLISPIQWVVLAREPFKKYWRKTAMLNFSINIEQIWLPHHSAEGCGTNNIAFRHGQAPSNDCQGSGLGLTWCQDATVRVLLLLKIEERNKKKEVEPPTPGSSPTPFKVPAPVSPPKPGSDNNNSNSKKKKLTIQEPQPQLQAAEAADSSAHVSGGGCDPEDARRAAANLGLAAVGSAEAMGWGPEEHSSIKLSQDWRNVEADQQVVG